MTHINQGHNKFYLNRRGRHLGTRDSKKRKKGCFSVLWAFVVLDSQLHLTFWLNGFFNLSFISPDPDFFLAIPPRLVEIYLICILTLDWREIKSNNNNSNLISLITLECKKNCWAKIWLFSSARQQGKVFPSWAFYNIKIVGIIYLSGTLTR